MLDADDYIIESDEMVHEVTIRPKNFRLWPIFAEVVRRVAKAVVEVIWQVAVFDPVWKPLLHRSGALGLMEPAAEPWSVGTVSGV